MVGSDFCHITLPLSLSYSAHLGTNTQQQNPSADVNSSQTSERPYQQRPGRKLHTRRHSSLVEMAVLPQFPGLKASIVIGDNEVQALEHDDPEAVEATVVAGVPTLTKYIESADGIKFGIKVDCESSQLINFQNHRSDSLSGSTSVDGQSLGFGKMWTYHKHLPRNCYTVSQVWKGHERVTSDGRLETRAPVFKRLLTRKQRHSPIIRSGCHLADMLNS